MDLSWLSLVVEPAIHILSCGLTRQRHACNLTGSYLSTMTWIVNRHLETYNKKTFHIAQSLVHYGSCYIDITGGTVIE